MKLIAKIADKDEAISIKYRLEGLGIPIFIGSENTGLTSGMPPFADSYTIWAEIDSQGQCAFKALEDETYTPIKPINIAEYRQFIEQTKQERRNSFSRFNNHIMTVIVLAGASYFAYRLYLALSA